MSDTRARASRRAFWFGSFARNGLIGFRCTTGVAGAGVDGVEKAADTLPPTAKAGGSDAAFGGGDDSGIVDLDGGVSGAPNDAANSVDAGFAPFGGASFETTGECLGENGGVRRRAGASGSALRVVLVTPADGAAVAPRGGGAASDRGTGGGHAVPAAAAAGVLALANTGFGPAGVVPGAGVGDAVLCETWRSSPQLTTAPTGIRPPHTEQRARIDTLVIFAGSSLKTERHSGQETFIGNAGWVVSEVRHAAAPA